MERLTQYVLLSDGNSSILRLCCCNDEYLDMNHAMNGLYFGEILDTLKPEVLRKNNKKSASRE